MSVQSDLGNHCTGSYLKVQGRFYNYFEGSYFHPLKMSHQKFYFFKLKFKEEGYFPPQVPLESSRCVVITLDLYKK